jgi:hypothetical protein
MRGAGNDSTMLLRNGQRTSSPLLDRVPFFDERSRNFPIRELVTARKPRSYTWALNYRVLDQGSEGACVGFGVSHELIAKPVAVEGVDEDFARAIYHEAQRIDEWPGGSYEGGEPFYEGTSVLAGVKVAQRLGHYSAYRWAFGLDDLILALGYAGPAVLGLNWYTGMFDADGEGRIHANGSVAGGHCIVALGVSLKRRQVLLANSWGPSWSTARWGDNRLRGHCTISFDDLGLLLDEQGEACIPTRSRIEI